MTFENVKSFVVGTIKQAFLNKKTLDKFTENEDGKVLYDGAEIATDIKVSEEEGNAIQKQEDGSLFVPDNAEELQEMKTKLDTVNQYQKYVNTELDYCYLKMTLQSDIAVEANVIVPFNTFVSGNMEYDTANCSIKLKAGKTYEIETDYSITNGFVTSQIYDKTNNKILGTFVKNISTSLKTGATNSNVVYTPKTDCEIIVKASWVSTETTPKIMTSNPHGYFIVKEIGHEIVIDPLEHANMSKGIEDCPVGHIISHMGTVAPAHYLICDGAEYNITDYPYLVQHIIDNFGSANYFGGDGTTTFAVPDLRGEFLRGTGTATRNTGTGAGVGVHQDATQFPYYGYTGTTGNLVTYLNNNTNNYPGATDKILSTETLKAYYSSNTSTTSSVKNYAFTSKPTNTAVLYCIKYEPTYFMNTYNNNYMQPILYSEDEKVIGAWINGKPLYQKTFRYTLDDKSTASHYSYNVDNIDCVCEYSLVLFDANNNIIPTGYRDASGEIYLSSHANLKYFNVMRLNPGHWAGCSGVATVKYTKSTDAENSFTDTMLKTSFTKVSSYTEDDIRQVVAEIVEEFNATQIDMPTVIPELYPESDLDTPTVIPELYPEDENGESTEVTEPDEPVEEPETIEPENTEPEVTEPESSEPDVTEPETEIPETEVVEPEVTETEEPIQEGGSEE